MGLFSSDEWDALPLTNTQRTTTKPLPPPPNHFVIISHDKELVWVLKDALKADNSPINVSSETTTLKFLKAYAQTPMTAKVVVFQPPSTMTKKAKRGLDEIRRLFPKALIIIITDVLDRYYERDVTIFSPSDPKDDLIAHMRKHVFNAYCR